ncbi:hypothetical protein HK096_006695 [Nowakowskiella sp. JEL0078]|nr:hypothetical protein HK096_006695 [Nowakowskiella sp. JEL0078]
MGSTIFCVTLDPVIVHTVLDRALTSILFSSKSSVVLIGDDTGSANVYKLKKSGDGKYATTEQHTREWQEKQMQILIDIMASKNHSLANVPAEEQPGN